MAEQARPGNTIKDSDWEVFKNRRARALEKMSPEQFAKHLNAHKQAKAAAQGRN